jgi:plasmid maintenance system antidote protein VapI
MTGALSAATMALRLVSVLGTERVVWKGFQQVARLDVLKDEQLVVEKVRRMAVSKDEAWVEVTAWPMAAATA